MKRIIKEVLSYVLIIFVVLLVKKYIFSPIKVNGDSMYPTLHNNDIMILNEIGYYLNGLERFDIVVVDTGKDKLIKRVIGLPGETVHYFENNLYKYSKCTWQMRMIIIYYDHRNERNNNNAKYES